ncbi:uncharacterized protein [Dysidea avara]|uniref:uncharacterized protein n=1 Tax=Dysidea avara TaxID=196820 RepID=UPI003323CB5F
MKRSRYVVTVVIGCSVLSLTLSGLYIWRTEVENRFRRSSLLQHDQNTVLVANQHQYEDPDNKITASSPLLLPDVTWSTTPAQVSTNSMSPLELQSTFKLPTNKVEIRYGASSYAGFKPLPKSVIDGVKTFVYFIGHARSGHSIVGSILDGHPHIVISHESKIFRHLIKVPYAAKKSYIFNTIWSSAFLSPNTGIRRAGAIGKGYTLAVNGLYQGTYESYIDVIGEKKGDLTTEMFLSSPTKLKSVIDKLNTALDLPLKVFHVIRNPFDNIATAVLYDNFRDGEIGKAKRYKGVYTFNTSLVDKEIETYFRYYQAIEDAKEMFKFDLMVIHGKDFVADPRTMIIKMCTFLQVHCPDHYLDLSSKKIFSSESKTRHKMKWEDYQISRVQSHIEKFSSLRRYHNFN